MFEKLKKDKTKVEEIDTTSLPELKPEEKKTIIPETKIDKYELVEVATQTDLVIRNNETGEIFNMQKSLVKILNELEKINNVLLK